MQEDYILHERGIETQFYRLTRGGVYQPLPRTDGAICSLVLPGFQFRIQGLYDILQTQCGRVPFTVPSLRNPDQINGRFTTTRLEAAVFCHPPP